MRSFRFLHCADLHLDSPLRGLEADPDAPAGTIREATREAFKKLVDFAINERIDFVVAAGDLYDGDWQDYRTGLFLVRQIARLSAARIPFIAIRGNHDAESVITRRLRMPSDIAWLLDHRHPETIRLPGVAVAIHGQSFATRSVTENIALGYPLPDPDRFNIGLLHSSIDGREGHDNYAPCSPGQLRDHGYDYWALGHIHAGERVLEDPWIVFPGNLQGRHIKECGPKGAVVVTVSEGRVIDVTSVTLDAVRWVHIEIDLPENADEDAVLTLIRAELTAAAALASPRLLAVRITLSGACAAHGAFSRDIGAARETIRAEAQAVGEAGLIWIETVEILTRAPAASIAHSAAMGKLVTAIETLPEDDVLNEVRLYAAAMLARAPASRQASDMGDGLPSDLIRRARELLLGNLAD